MINEFLKRLAPDFNNIDEVYSELLTVYNPDNINTTELTFINSVNFENVKRTENVLKLSMYLGKKSTHINWHDIDYYNSYIEKKRFYEKPIQTFKTNEYDKVVINLKEYKNRYNYIFEKLLNNDKSEFKNDFCDKLESLKSKQIHNKFNEIIIDLINQIENDYSKYKISLIAPQQTDEVKKEFKDFFNSDVKTKVIESIQNDFKDFKGKKMAHLIYLLHKDFKIINYSLNSRNESRKHFVSLLKGTDFRMAGIDRYFELSDVKLENPRFEIDPDYIDIKEKLLKTIK